MWMNGYGGGWPVIMMMVCGILMMAAVVVVGRRCFGRWGQMIKGDSALELLKRRYAGSEISKEEFEEKKNALLS